MTVSIYSSSHKCLITRLREGRLRCRMTQAQAGQRLGYSRHWVSKIEAGQLKLDVLTFVQMCNVYQLSPADLLTELGKELEG